MSFCPNCGTELEEGVTVCSNCGNSVTGVIVEANNYDHTAEFDAEDIESNKIFAILGYCVGFIGIIIAALAAKDSKYAQFHIKQALKIEVTAILAALATTLLCWTCIVPIAGIILILILTVLEFIAMVQVLMGLAKEPWLVRSFKFLGK